MAKFTFNKGTGQSFVVPAGVSSVIIDAYGAQGGASTNSTGGLGGRAYGTLTVTPGSTLFLSVGGQDGTSGGATGGVGGAGGGMTWVSTANGFAQGTVAIVAGGGGGGGNSASPHNGVGSGNGGGGYWGGGGGGADSTSATGGGGGTQLAGGAAGVGNFANGSVGTAGVGGNGTANQSTGVFPGPGNGGSGGGTTGSTGGAGAGSGGGGGSSFLSGSLGNSFTTVGLQSGDGLLFIYTAYELSPFETETVSESNQVAVLSFINVSETETESESVTVSIKSSASAFTNASVLVSSYKWLTQTLFSAQQALSVRPYTTCQIVDDSLLVNQQMFSSTALSGGSSGDVAVAPDGSLLVVGLKANGDLGFIKVTDGTQTANWTHFGDNTATGIATAANPPSTTSGYIPYNYNKNSSAHLNASIGVSDWINGTYYIDVYYWYHDNSSHKFEVRKIRSSDGGTTWGSTETSIQTTGISDASTGNFWIAAGTPVVNTVTGNVSSLVFFLLSTDMSVPAVGNNLIKYSSTSTGSFAGTQWAQWTSNYVDSRDWILHSMDAFYQSGVYYIAFAGYHTVYESTNLNNTIYLTRALKLQSDSTNSNASDVWTQAKEIFLSNSNASTNATNFYYPSLNFDGKYLWLTFRGDVVSTITEVGIASTNTNFYIMKSLNLSDYSYPFLVVDQLGVEFNATSNNIGKYNFVIQSSYYYFYGDGSLWQYIQNSVVADVSNSLISYTIDEQLGNASSINMTVDNSSGQWIGTSPTLSGASAIKRNSKIYLQQGYYNANGVAETVPKNVYYIDEINHNVSSTVNDLIITGRDWFKPLTTQTSKFTFNYEGPELYVDTFDGTTIQNWNQLTGTWTDLTYTNPSDGNDTFGIFVPSNSLAATISGGSTVTTTQTGLTLASLSGVNIKKAVSTVSVIAYLPASSVTGSEVDIYPMYVDPGNYVQVQFLASAGVTYINLVIVTTTAGITTTQYGWAQNSLSTTISTADYYPIYITTYGYSLFDVHVGNTGRSGNSTGAFGGLIFQKSSTAGFTFPVNFVATPALGSNGSWTGARFAQFKFTQYESSQNIEELTKKVATKGGVFNYVNPNDITQDFYNSTQWNTFNGSGSILNRQLNLSNEGVMIQNINQVSNGEVNFDAKVSTSTTTKDYGFDFVFRSQSSTSISSAYTFRIFKSTAFPVGIVMAELYINSVAGGNAAQLYSSAVPSGSYAGLNNINLDITKSHKYKIVFNNGWIYGFIDQVMVLAWFDNNYQQTFSTGYWGFSVKGIGNGAGIQSNNSSVKIWNLRFPTLWNQIASFAINPGDDFFTSVQTNMATVHGWVFSDLAGRMKLVLTKGTDPATYNYGNAGTNYQLWQIQQNQSDKEYVNQVTVFGNDVSAVAKNTTLIGQTGIVRELVIVDQKIQTAADAQTRANYELTNNNKYLSQPAPQLVNNVGSEIDDVIYIIDVTGSNASGINSNQRIYTQSIVKDSKTYHITLGTGALTT